MSKQLRVNATDELSLQEQLYQLARYPGKPRLLINKLLSERNPIVYKVIDHILGVKPQPLPASVEALTFRFIGQQTSCITVKSLNPQFDEFKNSHWEGPKMDLTLLGLYSLTGVLSAQ